MLLDYGNYTIGPMTMVDKGRAWEMANQGQVSIWNMKQQTTCLKTEIILLIKKIMRTQSVTD